MKHFALLMIFLMWFAVTAIAVVTILGVLILMCTEGWFEMPERLLDKM